MTARCRPYPVFSRVGVATLQCRYLRSRKLHLATSRPSISTADLTAPRQPTPHRRRSDSGLRGRGGVGAAGARRLEAWWPCLIVQLGQSLNQPLQSSQRTDGAGTVSLVFDDVDCAVPGENGADPSLPLELRQLLEDALPKRCEPLPDVQAAAPQPGPVSDEEVPVRSSTHRAEADPDLPLLPVNLLHLLHVQGVIHVLSEQGVQDSRRIFSSASSRSGRDGRPTENEPILQITLLKLV